MLSFHSRLNRAAEAHFSNERTRLVGLEAALHSIHPKRVLERGYAMTQTEDGTVVTNASMLHVGQAFELHFADGTAEAAVTEIHSTEEEQ